jgi:DNA-binding NtrC family response regulator
MDADGRQLRGLTILVAEGDARFARILADLIALYGGTAAGPAASEAAALGIVDAMPVDGVILNIRLREGAGFSLAGALTGRGIPVFLIAGDGPAAIPAACIDLPVFTMPFSLSDLVERLAADCRAVTAARGEPGRA